MNPLVKTQYGEVRGSVANGVNTFKGISYAAPPFGVNRLRPHTRWIPSGFLYLSQALDNLARVE